MPDEGSPQEGQGFEVAVEPADLVGVYSNVAVVHHSQYEFTIDFLRNEFSGIAAGKAKLVSRVTLSPLMVSQLIDALNENWTNYAQKALPREVYDDGGDEAPPSGEPIG